MALDAEQRKVRRGAVAGAAVSFVTLAAGYLALPSPLPPTAALSDRLALALQAELLVLTWLVVAVAEVANARFFSAHDIAGAGFSMPGPVVAARRAILQNTLEQVVLAVGAHAVLAVVLEGSEMILVPLLAALFCLGRLCFRLGYEGGAGSRAFGFALTFYPTVAAYLLAAALVLVRGAAA